MIMVTSSIVAIVTMEKLALLCLLCHQFQKGVWIQKTTGYRESQITIVEINSIKTQNIDRYIIKGFIMVIPWMSHIS